MAKVKAIDVSTDAGLPSGWTGTTRSTVATVQDHEGLIKDCLAEETRVHKGRRVENLVVASEDFTNAGWTHTSMTVTADKLTADAANVSCIDGYTAIAGDYVFSVELKRVTGTGNIQIAADDGAWTTVTLTGSYQRFSVQQTVAAGSKNCGIKIVTSGDEVNARYAQLELVEGQTNQNPSEYVSVGVYRENLLPRGIDFSHADWTKRKMTSVAESTAETSPLNVPVYLLTEDNTPGIHDVYDSAGTLTASVDYVVSVYAKANSRNWICLTGNRDNWHAYFDLSAGETGNSGTHVQSTSIVPEGDGWYRCISRITCDSAVGVQWQIQLSDSNKSARDPSYAGDGSSGVYVSAIQVERADAVSAWIPTNGAVAKEYDHGQGVDGPDGVQYFATTNPWTVSGNVATEGSSTALTGMSILLEPQGENHCEYSEDLNATGWTNDVTVTDDQAVAPDGLTTADEINEGTGSGQKRTYKSYISSSAGNHVSSIFVKDEDRGFAYVQTISIEPTVRRYGVVINLSTGAVTDTNTVNSPTSTAYEVEEYDNGWWRVGVRQNHSKVSGTNYVYIAVAPSNSGTPSYDSQGFPDYTGTSKKFYAWGGQIELSDVMTSYIANTGTGSKTRTTDTAPYAPLTTPQSAGTVVVEFENPPADPDAVYSLVSFDNTTLQAPILHRANDNFRIDDGPNTADKANLSDTTHVAATWDSTNGLNIGVRGEAGGWETWASNGTYDGGFSSDSLVYLGYSLDVPLYIKALDVYDDEKTESWIESNYPPSAPVTSSLEMAVAHITGQNSTGTQNATVSGFGTPTAAIIIANGRTAVGAGNNANMSIGFWDGTNNCGLCIASDDGSTNMETDRSWSNDHCYIETNGFGSARWEIASITGTVTDGVELTWDIANADELTVILIKGTLSASIERLDLSEVSTDNTVTPGHTTHALFAMSVGAAGATDGISSHASLNFGLGHYDGTSTYTQHSVGWYDQDAAANSNLRQEVSTDRILIRQNSTGLTWELTWSAVTSTQFTITSNTTTTWGNSVFFLCLELDEPAGFEVGNGTSPTSTGTKAFTTSDEPSFVGLIQTSLPNADQQYNTDDATGFCFGVTDGTTDKCFAFNVAHNAAVSDTLHHHQNNVSFLYAPADTGTIENTSAFSSFNATDFTLNYTAVDTTAYQNIWWAVLGASTGGSSPLNIFRYLYKRMRD